MNINTRITLLYAILGLTLSCSFGQQPSPIGILFNPRVNTFAISGVGGGNMYELNAQKSSSSGQVALDWNIGLADKQTRRGKDKFTTLTTIFKYNPFLQSNYVSGDSIETRKLAFVDNEFQMLLGFRLSNVIEAGTDNSSKVISLFFMDASMAPHSCKKCRLLEYWI